jgi:hypothetical protein
MKTEQIMSELKAALPPILFRSDPDFRRLTGVHPRTVANLDSQGRGPAERVRVGRSIGYPREALLTWLAQRLELERR